MEYEKFIVYLKAGYRIELDADEFFVCQKDCVVFRAMIASKSLEIAVFPMAELVACFDADQVPVAVNEKGVTILPKTKAQLPPANG